MKPEEAVEYFKNLNLVVDYDHSIIPPKPYAISTVPVTSINEEAARALRVSRYLSVTGESFLKVAPEAGIHALAAAGVDNIDGYDAPQPQGKMNVTPKPPTGRSSTP